MAGELAIIQSLYNEGEMHLKNDDLLEAAKCFSACFYEYQNADSEFFYMVADYAEKARIKHNIIIKGLDQNSFKEIK